MVLDTPFWAVGIGVFVLLFVLLRLLKSGSGGKTNPNQRYASADKANKAIANIKAHEQKIERLRQNIATAPDEHREKLTKHMEQVLNKKEKLKKEAEKLTKRT
jgi:gas vesicle protein